MSDETMTLDESLPKLPNPFGQLERSGMWNGAPREGVDDVFDADQMREYARHTIAAHGAAIKARAAEPPCSLEEAVRVMEKWAQQGLTLGDPIAQRFRAFVDKVAPAQPKVEVTHAMVSGHGWH